MKSVGTQLREGRQARGWTIKAAAKATKLREDQIQKLETDDFAKFHAPTYVRGFVRNYASALGLDSRQLSEELEKVLEIECEVAYLQLGGINYVPELAKQSVGFDPRRLSLVLAGIVFVGFLVAVGYQVYRVVEGVNLFGDSSSNPVAAVDKPAAKNSDTPKATKSDDQSAESVSNNEIKKATVPDTVKPAIKAPIAEPDTPVSSPTPSPSSVTPENKLAIMAREECWVRVSVLDNNQPKIIFEDLIPAGKTQIFPPASKYLLKARTPAVLEITLNGKTYSNPHANEQVPVEFSVPSNETN